MYMPLNIVAYQSGNAAKVAPPATSSHTSLLSHTVAIELIITRRRRSSVPITGRSMPTPRSKPPRMK